MTFPNKVLNITSHQIIIELNVLDNTNLFSKVSKISIIFVKVGAVILFELHLMTFSLAKHINTRIRMHLTTIGALKCVQYINPLIHRIQDSRIPAIKTLSYIIMSLTPVQIQSLLVSLTHLNPKDLQTLFHLHPVQRPHSPVLPLAQTHQFCFIRPV